LKSSGHQKIIAKPINKPKPISKPISKPPEKPKITISSPQNSLKSSSKPIKIDSKTMKNLQNLQKIEKTKDKQNISLIKTPEPIKKEEKNNIESTIPVEINPFIQINDENNDKTMKRIIFLNRQKSQNHQESTDKVPKLSLDFLACEKPEKDTKISTFSRNYLDKFQLKNHKFFDNFQIFDEKTQNFEITDVLLGFGANGSVYKILDKVKNLSFALKIIEITLGDENEFKYNDILNEIDIMEKLKTLNSDKFIEIEKVFRKQRKNEKIEEIFLMMELCDCNLQEILEIRAENKQFYSENELLFYYNSLFSALKIMHQANISHRDIKPRNLLYSQTKLKYADFGESKSFASETQDFSNTVRGTPLYMSPEVFGHYKLHQIEGKFDAFSSDLYSLGVTFLMMKHLEKTITRANIEEIIEKTKKENDLSSQIITKLIENDENERKKASERFFIDQNEIIKKISIFPNEKAMISIIELKRQKTESNPEHFKKLYLIGSMYYKLKNLLKAREIYLEILDNTSEKRDLNEDFIDILIYKTYVELGRVENDLISNKSEAFLKSTEVFSGIQRLEKAFDILINKLIKVFPIQTYKTEYGDLLNELGISNKNLGNIEKALEYYKKSMAFAIEIFGENSCNCAVTMHNLGELHFEIGEYKESQDFFARSLSINEGLREQEKDKENVLKLEMEIRRSLNDLGLSYMRTLEYEKSRLCFEKCRVKIKESEYSDFSLLGEVLNNLSMILMKMNLINDSEKVLDEAILLAETQNLPEIKALSYFNLGNLEVLDRKFGEAEKSFCMAMKIYEEFDGNSNYDVLGTLYYNLGVISINLKELEKAKVYLEKALICYEKSPNNERKAEILMIKETLKNLEVFLIKV